MADGSKVALITGAPAASARRSRAGSSRRGTGTARVTLPHLVDSRGHLVLMGSVGGKVTIDGSLYSATKWAVTGMAQAIRAEVHTTGVRVTVIQPGKVATPFFEGAPPPDCVEPEDVVAAVAYAISQPPRVDVNEVVLRPIDQHR